MAPPYVMQFDPLIPEIPIALVYLKGNKGAGYLKFM